MNDQIFICSDLLERIIYLLSEISISGILKGGLRCSLLLFDQKKKEKAKIRGDREEKDSH